MKQSGKDSVGKIRELVRNLMRSPAYRLPLEDTDFLKSYNARGIRLQMDYLKAEATMERLNIKQTVVVFGSARIAERSEAVRNLEFLKKKLQSSPDSEKNKVQKQLNRAEKLLSMSRYYDDARELGRMIGRSGEGPLDNRIMLMTGGGPGIMEAANRGAYDAGALSIGLNIQLPHEQFPNPYVSPDLCFQFHYFAIRKLHFLLRARALIAYPGGFGTLDETFEILTLIQTAKTEAIPAVLIGKKFWSKLIDFNFLKEQGMIDNADLELFRIAENAQEAWNHIVHWHRGHKTPLCHLYTV